MQLSQSPTGHRRYPLAATVRKYVRTLRTYVLHPKRGGFQRRFIACSRLPRRGGVLFIVISPRDLATTARMSAAIDGRRSGIVMAIVTGCRDEMLSCGLRPVMRGRRFEGAPGPITKHCNADERGSRDRPRDVVPAVRTSVPYVLLRTIGRVLLLQYVHTYLPLIRKRLDDTTANHQFVSEEFKFHWLSRLGLAAAPATEISVEQTKCDENKVAVTIVLSRKSKHRDQASGIDSEQG